MAVLVKYLKPEYCTAITALHIFTRCDSTSVSKASPDGWAVWGVVMFTRWWLLVDHCVLRNWDRILVRAVKGLISRAGMVSICPLLWQRDVKLQQTKTSVSKGIGKLKPIKMLQTYARFQSILFYVCPCWGVAGYSKSPGRTWGVHLCHVWSASIKRCQCSCDTCSSRRGVGYTMGL